MSSYDQNLLGEAPRATRAQLQQGYSVDLLEPPAEAPRRTPSLRTPTPHIPQPGPAAIAVPLTPAIAENGSGEKFDSPAPVPAPRPKVSFWRTRNGIITIALLALIAIGAIVGGAVGGTAGKKSSAAPSNVTTFVPIVPVTPSVAGSQSSTSQPISSPTSVLGATSKASATPGLTDNTHG